MSIPHSIAYPWITHHQCIKGIRRSNWSDNGRFPTYPTLVAYSTRKTLPPQALATRLLKLQVVANT